MAEKNLSTIDNIIQFLENEREMYGDFSIPTYESVNQPQEDDDLQPESSKKSISIPEESSDTPKPLTLQQKLELCTNLDDLRVFCQKAEELKTDLKNTNLVFGVGNPNADLVIVGEAPGEQEDIQGEPFVGAAGQLLNKILDAIDFGREDVYIANILKHRPPGNRNPTSEERRRSLPYLMRQIDLIDPKLILCLGRVSATTLLDRDTTLGNLRGKFYPFRNAELTVTYHPAALLRNAQWKRPTWEDVQQVRKRYDELGCKP